jgi:hypothetical protein
LERGGRGRGRAEGEGGEGGGGGSGERGRGRREWREREKEERRESSFVCLSLFSSLPPLAIFACLSPVLLSPLRIAWRSHSEEERRG